MRTLLVLRHAKSDWPEGVPDLERPLASRGRRDAAAAGRWLKDEPGQPELVICSTALRARQTWEQVQARLDDGYDVQFDERVYNAPVSGLVSVLREVPVEKTKVLLIGHNPGCVDLVLSLSAGGDPVALGDVETKYPTAGIAEIAISGQWHDLAAGCGELRRFVVPRG